LVIIQACYKQENLRFIGPSPVNLATSFPSLVIVQRTFLHSYSSREPVFHSYSCTYITSTNFWF